MKNNGNIWRDENGICHIEADNKADAYRLMGYAHGRDRGMQVLLMRILGQGRASEILDSSDEMVAIDTFFRRMNWHGAMAAEMEKVSEEAGMLTGAYCDGINQALSERLPWECRIFGYKPEPWTVENTIMILRMIGYLTLAQSQGELEYLLIEMIQAGLEEQRLEELFPGVLGGLDIELIRKIQLQERIVSPATLWNIAAPLAMASNNWVVSGSKTASGVPILANDPHLEVNRLPNVWCEMAVKIGNRYAVGAGMPGVPALLIGKNRDVSWGATYTFMDATDSWIEHCRDGKFKREDEDWIPFEKRTEVIKRKKKSPVTITFYENLHGVLEGDPSREGYYLSTAWAPSRSGAKTLNQSASFFDFTSVEEGMAVLGRIETAWNWVLADRHGNIGYQMSGLMPKRREDVSGLVPLPGWDPRNDWQGFENPEDLPRSYNPECGYFVTSNQDLNEYGRVNPINAGMGSYRSDRIARLLEASDKLTLVDMQRMQHDFYSIQAEVFMAILRPLLPESNVAEVLGNWNLEYTEDSEGACLFDRFYRELYRQVFGQSGLGVDVIDAIDSNTGIFNDFYVYFDRVLLSETSVWFGGRSREEIYRQALSVALASPPEKWGEGRRVVMKNIVFDGRLPRFLGFDRGPITIAGSLATPHQGQVFESAGRQTSFAPSLRMVVDTAADEIHTNMAGGPSDRRFSKWYCSDLENWETGIYKTVSINGGGAKAPFK